MPESSFGGEGDGVNARGRKGGGREEQSRKT